jgi:hypothetical protein
MEVIGLGQLDDGSVEAKKTAEAPSAGQDPTPERIQQLVEQAAYSLYEERQKAGMPGSSEQDWEDAKQVIRNTYGVDIA